MKTLLTGVSMGESPRWHDGRLWFSDWGAQEIIAVDAQGKREVVRRVPFELPFSFDWLPDGRLIVIAGREAKIHDDYADLASIAAGWNEIVVDGRGNTYVNGVGVIALVTPDGRAQRVADGGAFPNGMAVTPDNSTLILAESYARQLAAFDIAVDGTLSNRRTWAALGNGVPDGICMDTDGAVWYADVPNRCCVRVREGGDVLDKVQLDRGGFACMLGGADGRTLYIVANEWRGMDKVAEVAAARTGQILTFDAPSPHTGWP
jgi:sugar lactone lactonase YvrE